MRRFPGNSALPVVLVTFMLAVAGAAFGSDGKGISHYGSATLGGGFESNIYRRPSVLDTGSDLGGRGSYNPVVGDGFAYASLWSYSVYAPHPRHRFQLALHGEGDLFFSHADDAEGALEGFLDYRFQPAREWTAKVGGRTGRTILLIVDPDIDDVADLYEFQRHGGTADMRWEPSHRFDIEAGYRFDYLDYADSSADSSIDNRQQAIFLASALHLGRKRKPHTLTLEGGYGWKDFPALGARDENGDILPGNPLRSYRLWKVALGYARKFAAAEWRLEAGVNRRSDIFRDYLSYTGYFASTDLDAVFGKTAKLEAGFGWKRRNYDVKEAFRPGINPKLAIDYFDADLKYRHRVWRQLFLTGEYELEVRTTNTGYESYHTYRDYTDHTLKAGVRVEW